jgi:hypothetical protein
MIDKQLDFGTVTPTAATDYDTDVIDMGTGFTAFGAALAPPDPGEGMNLIIVCMVTEAFSGGTNVTPKVLNGAADNPTTVILTGPTVVTASLTLGAYIWRLKLPPDLLRYLRLRFTSTGVYTLGKIRSFLTNNFQTP